MKCKTVLTYLLHDRAYFLDAVIRKFYFLFPDKLYLSLRYRLNIGRWIDWKNPQTFTEKLQWLKLYDRHSEYTTLVDKYAVKDYVAKIIGQEYIIPTIGVWNNVEEIDWNSLPNQFVVKATNDSGGVVICKNKNQFDIDAAVRKLKRLGGRDYSRISKEYPYKGVPHRFIAEEYLENEDSMGLEDYKFFCFNGLVKFFKIDFGRFVEHHANYYSIEGNLLPFGEVGMVPDFNHKEIIPENLDEMISIAERLSQGHSFLRVDLYNISEKIFFGELTFFPASGLCPFTMAEWDCKIGEYLKLPDKK